MKHSKTTLKFNLNIRKSITLALNSSELIKSISYTVDWSNFPNSLKLQCQIPNSFTVDQSNEAKTIKIIQLSFLKHGIKFRNIRENIKFELTTENS